MRLCAADAGAEPVPPGAALDTLAIQISGALNELEPDMAEAERYLVAQLGKLEDPIVDQDAHRLSSSPRIPPDLRTEARRLLALRKNGNEYMLSALGRHYDFVSGVLLPPPVGPLADALAASGEVRAAPLLAKHLNDPANSAEDVAHAARALVKLATPAEYEDLRTFFALYRAHGRRRSPGRRRGGLRRGGVASWRRGGPRGRRARGSRSAHAGRCAARLARGDQQSRYTRGCGVGFLVRDRRGGAQEVIR